MTEMRSYRFAQRTPEHFKRFRERLWRESRGCRDISIIYPFRFGQDELVVLMNCAEQGPLYMQPNGDLVFRVNAGEAVNIVVDANYTDPITFYGESGKDITTAKNKVVKVTNYKLKR